MNKQDQSIKPCNCQKCDGNHAPPSCLDPQCWHKGAPEDKWAKERAAFAAGKRIQIRNYNDDPVNEWTGWIDLGRHKTPEFFDMPGVEYRIHPEDLTPDRCPTCGSEHKDMVRTASGYENRSSIHPCEDDWHNTPSNAATQPRQETDCPNCKGTGETFASTGYCPRCGGTGTLAATPAPEPWKPKYQPGQRVKWNKLRGEHEFVFIKKVLDDQRYAIEWAPGSLNDQVREDRLEWAMPLAPAGHEWHRNDFTEAMLPPGTRPLCKGEDEQPGDEYAHQKEMVWHECDELTVSKAEDFSDWYFRRTTRPAPSPAQAEPTAQTDESFSRDFVSYVGFNPATAQTAGEAAFRFFHHPAGVSWEEGSQERRDKWERVAQAAIAFAQSSRVEPKPFPTPQDVMHAASKKHSRMKQAKRNVEQASGELPSVEELLRLYDDVCGQIGFGGEESPTRRMEGISAVREACMRAVPMTQDVEVAEFRECELCAQKPGSPPLCESCLNNRHVIWTLKQRAEAAEQTIADLRREIHDAGESLGEMMHQRNSWIQQCDKLKAEFVARAVKIHQINADNFKLEKERDEARIGSERRADEIKQLSDHINEVREELAKANQHTEDVFERYTEGVLKMVRNLGSKAEIDTSPGETEHETRGHILSRAEDAIQALLDEARESLQKVEEETERQEEKLIAERDEAEEAMSKAYQIVTGAPPEWSNAFGFQNAHEEMEEVVEGYRRELASLKASSGWVALSERKPTREDADNYGCVLWGIHNGFCPQRWDKPFQFKDGMATHWCCHSLFPPKMQLPTPPPSPEEGERKEFEAWASNEGVSLIGQSLPGYEKNLTWACWQAARKTKGAP